MLKYILDAIIICFFMIGATRLMEDAYYMSKYFAETRIEYLDSIFEEAGL